MPEQRKTPDGGSYTIFSKDEYDALVKQRPSFVNRFLPKPKDMGDPMEYILRSSFAVSEAAWEEYRTDDAPPPTSDPDFELIYTRLAGPVTSGEVDAAGLWRGKYASQSEAVRAANEKLKKDRSFWRGVLTTDEAMRAIKESIHRQKFTEIDRGLRGMGLVPVYYRFASGRKQKLVEGDPIFIAFDGGHGDMLDEFRTGRRLPYRWEKFDDYILATWIVLAQLYQRQQRDGIEITAVANAEALLP